jgi:hypothetical protein
MGEEERFQEIKWLLNATIEEFDSFFKSAGGFEDVKVGSGWDPSKVSYFPYLLTPMPASKALESAEKKKVEIFRSMFWIVGPKRENIEMIGEPRIEFVPRWEIEGYHECFFFRDGVYHLKVKDDVVAIEVEGKLRSLVTESSSNINQTAGTKVDEKTGVFTTQKPKFFTIDSVVELAYQSRTGHLYLDESGAEDREFEALREKYPNFENLSERTDLDDLLKGYLREATEKKKLAFEKLRDKIVKPPENFSKILSNRFEVTRLNLYLIPFYSYRYRHRGKVREMKIHGVTGELLEYSDQEAISEVQ